MQRFVLAAALGLTSLAGVALADATAPQFVTLQHNDMLSSNVVGLDVYDSANNDIGKIQDVAFDNSKAVKGYILSVGGFLGVGAHYVAVDTGSVNIRYDAEAKKWRASMSATKEQLKAAPEFKYEGEWNASKS
jgi:sporulation protein YlmC with PRC-barrel domain